MCIMRDCNMNDTKCVMCEILIKKILIMYLTARNLAY